MDPASDSWLDRLSPGDIPPFRHLPPDIQHMLLDSDSDASEPSVQGSPIDAPVLPHTASPVSPTHSPIQRFVKARTPQSGSETEPSTPLSLGTWAKRAAAPDKAISPPTVVGSPAGSRAEDPFAPGHLLDQASRQPRTARADAAMPFTAALRLADPPSPSPAPRLIMPFVGRAPSPVRAKRYREIVDVPRETRKAKVDGG
ncbi:hypothetical protein FA95DRAFT_1612908 [Auriscalpium vulgare]|uniref:Uncharacterized protein n=1 Tax=Auriscalpium vulgare TaxID=40419 RepID=A0ACB8R5W4_9AGAM|nr:hypothetical protein FA95DRAFT_1612908 [Auriscalpium vulgare]